MFLEELLSSEETCRWTYEESVLRECSEEAPPPCTGFAASTKGFWEAKASAEI